MASKANFVLLPSPRSACKFFPRFPLLLEPVHRLGASSVRNSLTDFLSQANLFCSYHASRFDIICTSITEQIQGNISSQPIIVELPEPLNIPRAKTHVGKVFTSPVAHNCPSLSRFLQHEATRTTLLDGMLVHRKKHTWSTLLFEGIILRTICYQGYTKISRSSSASKLLSNMAYSKVIPMATAL